MLYFKFVKNFSQFLYCICINNIFCFTFPLITVSTLRSIVARVPLHLESWNFTQNIFSSKWTVSRGESSKVQNFKIKTTLSYMNKIQSNLKKLIKYLGKKENLFILFTLKIKFSTIKQCKIVSISRLLEV